MKSGFVNIFGQPNAGKSSLLNALSKEKLAIVTPKVQTTRHRIKAILDGDGYQIVLSDTPGIIEPKYKLHKKMMQAVSNAQGDTDVALLLADVAQPVEQIHQTFENLRINAPSLLLLNKIDLLNNETQLNEAISFFEQQPYAAQGIIPLSVKKRIGIDEVLKKTIELLPEGMPYFEGDAVSDMPTRFFVSELIREQIYYLYGEEIPYQTTAVIQEYKEETHITKIRVDIIVQRESQKAILLGSQGKKIKELGIRSREAIEKFIDHKVFLSLFVKVRDNWRDNDLYLKEYGY